MTDVGAPENQSSPDPVRAEKAAKENGAVVGLSTAGRLLLALLYLLPKNGLSRWAGRIASLRLPGPVQRAVIRLFARLVGADLAEARDPIESYDSLQKFFTRALRAGARPIAGDSMSLVAPCDGAWGGAGRIEEGTLLQVKGRTYSVAEFLGAADLAEDYEGGSFATFYLSPRDYHRFHTPMAGRMLRVDYQPGALWPVNSIGLQGIDRLFARNERICAYLQVDVESGRERPRLPPIALVAVGATMVGSVRLRFDPLRTNRPGARRACVEFGERAPAFERGEEWGHFEFGSTIVMLTPPGTFEIDFQPVGRSLRLGEVLGRRLG